jgi:hypothetical protein
MDWIKGRKQQKDVGLLKVFDLKVNIPTDDLQAESSYKGYWVKVGKWFELGRESKFSEKWGQRSLHSRAESIGDEGQYPR